jgi:inosine-uridine nucleoside N-ribohydrolase
MDLPHAIWIDTDIAMGADHGDVDDGFAMAAILSAAAQFPSRWQVAGVSVVNGNTDATTALGCAKAMLSLFSMGNTILVHSSAAAAHAIASLDARATLLALGPLTNIANIANIANVAAAVQQNPIAANEHQLYWVGGVLRPWSIRRRLSDLNVRRDPLAAAVATTSNPHARQFPLDVIDRLTADAAQLNRIAATGKVGRYLAESSARWLRYAWLRHGVSAFPVWDLVPALHALGKLPEATFDDKNRLTHFDPRAAWRAFEDLLAGG